MLHMPQEIPDRGSNSWHLTNCFAFWDPVCHVNIAGCTFLGSKACFPHLTFAYITVRLSSRLCSSSPTSKTQPVLGCIASLLLQPASGRAGLVRTALPCSSAKASWPCSTLCCFAADISQEAICTARLPLLGSGNMNPLPIPLLKGGKQGSCVLFKTPSLGPTPFLHARDSSDREWRESSSTLGWAEMLKISHVSLPMSSDQHCRERCVFEWWLIGDKGQQGRKMLLPTFPIQNIYMWLK